MVRGIVTGRAVARVVVGCGLVSILGGCHNGSPQGVRDAGGDARSESRVDRGADWGVSSRSDASPDTRGGSGDAGADVAADATVLTIPDGSSSIEDASSVEAGAGGWVNRTPDPIPPTLPSRRADAALAYDSHRHKMVLFGGIGGDGFTASLGDTLEWDATTGAWSDVSTTTGPAPQEFANLVFDDRLNSALLFGGSSLSGGLLGWDGSRWTVPSDPGNGSPVARQSSGITFDSGRGKLICFGGITSAGTILDELWEWDTVSGWVNRTPSPRPPLWPSARVEPHGLAYDAARGVSVLFSGGAAADLWEWNGTTGVWTNRTPTPLPAVWPSSLTRHSLVYDPVRARTVVLGGELPDGYLESIWEWDGATGAWTEHPPPPLQQDSPLPLTGLAAAYDTYCHRIVMVTGDVGSGEQFTRQTWEWDGASATFTDRTVPATWPRAREQFGFAFDTLRGKAVMFGGALGSEYVRDLWEWDGAAGAWTDRTPELLPLSWPGPGVGFSSAYDQARDRVVAYGVYGGLDLREWDPTSGTWTNRTPSPVPASWTTANAAAAMAYDAKRKRIVLFGGYNGSSQSTSDRARSDTWELDPEALVWRTATTSHTPPGRFHHAMAYDSRRGSVVLFGGEAGDSSLLRDSVGVGRRCRTVDQPHPPAAPGDLARARSTHALAYNAARGRIVLFGGVGANADTWEWDGVTGLWEVIARPPRQPHPAHLWGQPRAPGACAHPHPVRGAVALFGGREPHGQPTLYRDLWEWGRP